MKAKILIVDDEEAISLTIKNFLLRDGHEVDTAIDYDEAVEKFSKTEFDLIFSDIFLGEKTGIDVLREAKRRNIKCPFVLITGSPDIKTATEAVRMGAYDYMFKPIKMETILHVTNRALQYKTVVCEKEKFQSNLEAIFRSVKDAIITVDKELRIIEFNKAAEDICGFSKDIKGKKYGSFLSDCSGQCLDALNETIKTKLPAEISRFECGSKHRPRRVVSVNTYPLIDHQEKSNGCVMVLRDETHLDDLECDLQERRQFHNIIGKNDKLQKIYSLIEALANTQTTVLITGENGTGKGMIAEALHYQRNDSKTPFVIVNCVALSENLLESELFGHVKGAFTGAVSDRVGRFQMADGGTIFLDEIGDISNTMQLRLLRVIQDMEFERVGESTSVKVNVRIIAATNQDLRKKVRYGKFREDLYHRLKVVEVTMPPLRDRSEDIPLLVEHFIEKLNKKFNKEIRTLSADVQKIFMNYKWPGNIRELQHVLEHAFVLCNKTIITREDIPADFLAANSSVTRSLEKSQKSEDDRQALVQALKDTGWNKAKAARLLGVDRKTVYLKIKKYDIEVPN